MKKGHLVYYGLLLLAWAFYAYFTFQSSALKTVQGLGFTPLEVDVVVLAIIIPYGVIWFIGLYGALSLRSYVQTILNTPDGGAFARIDVGLFILVLSVVVPSFLGAILTASTSMPELVVPLTLVINYSYTILPFIAFGIIYVGTIGLTKLVKRGPLSLLQRSVFLIPLVAFAVLYFWLTFTIPNVTTVYHLPDILIMFTLLVPALLAWVFGILASVNMGFYRREVQGIIYKRSAALLVKGVLTLTVGHIFYLVISSLGPYLSSVGTGALLAIIYLFLAVLGLGYLFVAQGAKRLSRLEGDLS